MNEGWKEDLGKGDVMPMDVPVGGVREEGNASSVGVQPQTNQVIPMMEKRVLLGDCTNTLREGSQ